MVGFFFSYSAQHLSLFITGDRVNDISFPSSNRSMFGDSMYIDRDEAARLDEIIFSADNSSPANRATNPEMPIDSDNNQVR